MKPIALAVALLIVVGVIWRFPLFHVVRLDAASSVNELEKFSAVEFAERFWNDRLLVLLAESPQARVVLAALRENPEKAGDRYGRTVGFSRARLLCVRGSGTVVSIDKQGVGVSLNGASGSPELVLQTGMLFGNTVRDASGLLDAGEFSNSQHYNEISTELNRMVETHVIVELKQRSEVGKLIKFYACGQFLPESSDVLPLRLIPLKVDFD
jgi:predicted lipoprotein